MQQNEKLTARSRTETMVIKEKEDNKKIKRNSYADGRKETIIGIILTVTAGILWGLSGVSGQYLFQHGIAPIWLTCARMLVAGGILFIVLLLSEGKKSLRIWHNRMDVVHLFVFAIAGLAFCQLTYFLAIQYSNAGTATVLQYLAPVMILFVVCVQVHRMPKYYETFGVIMALIGTFLLATHGSLDELALSKQGLFWGLVAAVAMMLYTLLPGKIADVYGSTAVTCYGMLIGGSCICVLIKFWQWEVHFTIMMWLAFFAVAVLGTAVAYVLYLQSVRIMGPVKTSVVATIEPVAAMILSAVLLDVSFGVYDFIGLVLIVATIILLAKK